MRNLKRTFTTINTFPSQLSCCITNYYKFSSFKQLFIICSYKSEFGHSIAGFSAQGLNKAEIKVSEGIHHPESSSKLTWVFGRIQFLSVIGLGSPFSCWLSARAHSQQATAVPGHGALSQALSQHDNSLLQSQQENHSSVLRWILILYNCNRGRDYPITFSI